MKKLALLAAIMISAIAYGQDDNVVNDKNAQLRPVGSFSGIEIGGGIDLYLNQGGKETVAVSADDPEVRDKIVTEVKNGILKIYLKQDGWKWSWHNNRHMKAYVSCANINKLSAGGGSDVYVKGTLKLDRLEMNASGGSDFRGTVQVKDLSVECSGGSDVYISGSAEKLDVNSSGGSDYHGFDLVSDYCNANASGGSDASVTVNKEINAVASGGSDIYYKGSAAVRKISSSGGSDIKFKG